MGGIPLLSQSKLFALMNTCFQIVLIGKTRFDKRKLLLKTKAAGRSAVRLGLISGPKSS